MGFEGVESFAVVVVERYAELDAFGQIGIGDEMPTEGDGVGVAFFDDFYCGLWFVASRRNNLPLENLAKLFGGDGGLPFGDDDVSLHSWLDDVKVGESEAIQLFGDVSEERLRVAVGDPVPGSARCDPGGDAIASQTETNASTVSSRKRARFSIEPP